MDFSQLIVPTGAVLAAITGVLLNHFLLRKQNNPYDDSLIDEESGLRKVHRKIPSNLRDKFETAESSIRVVQTWMDNFSEVQMCLEEAIKNGASAQILLSSPNSKFLNARAEEFGITPENATQRVESALNDISAFIEEHAISKKVEIRTYETTPTFSLYSYDGISFITPYWRKKSAIQSPQLEVHEPGYLADYINDHFSMVWESATPYK